MSATPTYLISKIADPIFAATIGTFAALNRIRRQEREKAMKANPEPANAADAAASSQIGFGDVLGIGARRVRRWWDGDFQGV